jgi:putative FmdB family regulatory protein
MPIYEYRCEKCGDFEHSQRITAPALQRCPKCKRKVRRLISNTSFQLKGSGWYVTDYARAGGKDKGKTENKTGGTGDAAGAPSSGDSGGTTASDSTKSDKKPAPSKPESKTSASA